MLDDVVGGGPPERARGLLLPSRPRWTEAFVGFAAGALLVGIAGSALQQDSPSSSAGVVLSCNDPLPERYLNINLSWGSPADEVTLDLGDGQRKKLRPEYSDESALSAEIQHQYERAGIYQVVLTTRRASSTASAECTFNATD